MPMTKYAGITWYKDNYGSILQAYALQELVKRIDPDCRYEQLRYSGDSYSLKGKIRSLIRKGPSYAFKRIIDQMRYPEIQKRKDGCAAFVKEHIRESEKIYDIDHLEAANADYDGFFCGSDQIWNHRIVPVKPHYLLSFAAEGKKRIAFAPSMGDTLDALTADRMRQELPKFTAVSCREKTGTSLINRALQADICRTICDPTIAVSEDVWNKISEKPVVSGDYIFCYLLGPGKETRKHIEMCASKLGLKIITIPYADAQNVEKYDRKIGTPVVADPAQFISLIRHSKYVFTDSFHCGVFSSIFHVPFIIYPKNGKKGQNERIAGLQRITGNEFGFVNTDDSFETVEKILSDYDWKTADENRKECRKEAERFLRLALKEK